jgi:hypothetical protein
MNLHGKLVQNCRHEGIARKPKSTGEEVVKHDDFIRFGSRNLLIEGSSTFASRKKPSCLVFPDQICGDIGFTKNKRWRE